MAYDEALAERIREIIAPRPNVTERKMFGALCWMIGGNLGVGIVGGDELLVRVSDEDRDRVLAEPHVRPFEMSGRATRGFVVVGSQAIAEDDKLAEWVDAGSDYAASLPPKAPKPQAA